MSEVVKHRKRERREEWQAAGGEEWWGKEVKAEGWTKCLGKPSLHLRHLLSLSRTTFGVVLTSAQIQN